MEEPPFDPKALEEQFCQKVAQQQAEAAPARSSNAKQTVSFLDAKRNQAVGILLGSARIDLPSLATAMYSLNSRALSNEQLRAFYNARLTAEELALISQHVDSSDPAKIPLARADDFLYGLTRIHCFVERADCWLFRASFAEIVYDIEKKTESIQQACVALDTCTALPRCLSLILALGNYLNAGTARGQADGFNIDILPLLKDVKSQDGKATLLGYAVQLLFDSTIAGDLTCEPASPLPDPGPCQAAALLSLDDLDADLKKVESELGKPRKDKFSFLLFHRTPPYVSCSPIVLTMLVVLHSQQPVCARQISLLRLLKTSIRAPCSRRQWSPSSASHTRTSLVYASSCRPSARPSIA